MNTNKRTENKGRGRALKLNTGSGTHLTLVYFKPCADPTIRLKAVPDRKIKEQALQYLRDNKSKYPNYRLDLEVGEMWGRRSILILGAIKDFQRDLIHHFHSLGYEVDMEPRAFTPHINLMGRDKSIIRTKVNLVTDMCI